MTWTPERITELKRLWETGASTAEIGRQLDVSKNAVVGKVHRLGLPGRPSPIRREARTVARPGVAESRPRSRPQIPGEFEASPIMAQGESVPRAAAEAEAECRAQAVVDLHAPPCQWPFGDPGEEDFHFCGAPSLTGRPYCPEHCDRAYVREERRDRRSVRPGNQAEQAA
ncbi:MAG: GcrA family cell cycle regulator [Alphaproteobacteria bacterium]